MTGSNLGSTRLTAEYKKRNRSRRVTKKEKTRKARGQREGREAMRIFGDKLIKIQGWCILRLSPGPSERAWRDKRGRLYDQRHFNFRKTHYTPSFLSIVNPLSTLHITLYIFLSFHTTHTTYHPPTTNNHIKMQFSTKLSVAAAFAAVANAALTVNSPVRSFPCPLSSPSCNVEDDIRLARSLRSLD